MIEPLRIAFDVRCPPAHAFETWTTRTSAWWPKGASMSGEDGLQVVFEPRVGGRIFERTRSGREMEWGRITAWEPPHRVGYRWHIATEPAEATDVEIVFRQQPDGTTRVEIEHGGWDLLGERGAPWREANQAGWDGVLPAYRAACEVG